MPLPPTQEAWGHPGTQYPDLPDAYPYPSVSADPYIPVQDHAPPPPDYLPNPYPVLEESKQQPLLSRRKLLIGGVAAAALVAGGSVAASRIFGGGSGTVQVAFTFSTEKADWLNAALTAFRNSPQATLAGSNKVIEVTVNNGGSLDAKDQIMNGSLQPVAWSPANSVELNRLNHAWIAAKKNNGNGILYSSTDLSPRSLASSPFVFAVWADRARAFIQHYGKIDWDTLHKALLNNSGWGAAGHPEWGAIKLGQTNPNLSNSGLLSIMLMAYAYARNNRQVELTLQLVQKPDLWNSYIQVFEEAVTHFGASSGSYFQTEIIPKGPSQYSISLTYENLVLLYESQAQQSGGKQLQIYYPGWEFISDHPFAILNAPWVSQEQTTAAKQLLNFLLSTEQQKLALQYGLRPADPTISLTDSSIPNNRFKQLAQLSPGQSFDPRSYPTVSPPQGDVTDELIRQWNHYNPDPA